MKNIKIIAILLCLTMLVGITTACGSKNDSANVEMIQFEKPKKDNPIATIKVQDFGEIKIMLFKKQAPKAVENFIGLAKKGYYNNGIFHRVIKDFMIQGGDPEGTGMGGQSIWGKPFEDEFDKSLRNYRGALSMANSGPNTNGSQFFIVQANKVDESLLQQMEQAGYPKDIIEKYKQVGGTPWLDGKHTVFGQVIEGMDVVDKIAEVAVGSNDKPLQNVIIETITIKE